jgi:sec-independent protein translocase protein TatC
MTTKSPADQEVGTLTSHLIELRYRLIRILWAMMLGTALCYNYSENIFNWLRAPIEQYLPAGGLVFTAPADKFIAHLKISFFSGVLITTPIWIYQLWKFIAPALYKREKNYAVGFIFSGSALFVVGVSFAYFIAFPAAFHFLMTFGGNVDKPMITIDQYLSFVVTTALMFGLAFELPVVLIILGMMGIISQKFLKEKRRYAIVVLGLIAAILTPPDLLSMLLMLIPMILLYEISIIIVGIFERKRLNEAT